MAAQRYEIFSSCVEKYFMSAGVMCSCVVSVVGVVQVVSAVSVINVLCSGSSQCCRCSHVVMYS